MSKRLLLSPLFLASLFFSTATLPVLAANKADSAENSIGISSLVRFIQRWESTSAKKGEFESSSEYEKRLSSDGFAGQRFTIYVPLQAKAGQVSSKPYSYDADKRELTVWFGGHGSISNSDIATFVLNYNEPIPPRYPKYYLSYQEKIVDRYSATNSYGARTIVTSMRREDVSFALANYPLGRTMRPPFQRTISASPSLAKELSENAYWRFTVESTLIPSQREYIAKDIQQIEATIQYPTKLIASSKVLLVNLVSAELVNGTTNEVVLDIKQDSPTAVAPKNEECASQYSLMTGTKLCK